MDQVWSQFRHQLSLLQSLIRLFNQNIPRIATIPDIIFLDRQSYSSGEIHKGAMFSDTKTIGHLKSSIGKVLRKHRSSVLEHNKFKFNCGCEKESQRKYMICSAGAYVCIETGYFYDC
jgi:hypothetical protein